MKLMKKCISVFLIVSLLACGLCVRVEAKDKNFFADKTKLTLNKTAVVTITSTNGSALHFKVKNGKLCSGKFGKWKGSKIKLTLTAKKSGKTTVVVTNKKSKKTINISVTVKVLKVKSISLSKKTLTLKKGAAATLKATVVPAKALNRKVKWTSSNSSVADVSSSGKVTAKKSGIATITAATVDGSKLQAKCTVTVLNRTVNSKVEENLELLRDYILEKGDQNSYGEAGIFGSASYEDSSYIYSIIYLPKEKMFRFGWTDYYSDDPDEYYILSSYSFKYSLTGFDVIGAELFDVYYEYDVPLDSFSADIFANVATYNPESTAPTIKVTSNTYEFSNEKVKEYSRIDFNAGLSELNNLLFEETGLRLSDIGFNNY